MKKLLVIFLIIGLYLNLTYAYFYNFLKDHRLFPPNHEITTIIGNQRTTQTIKYVSLGDSLTAGVGAVDYKNSYPYLLARKISSKNNVQLTNLARSGDTAVDVLTNQLSPALAAKPNLVTLLIGTNDLHNLTSLSEFEGNLTRIVSSLKTTGAKIYLLSLPYLGSPKIVYFPYNLILDFRTKQFNQVIKKVANEMKVEYIDLYTLKKGADFYSSDQFHPSNSGYRGWAKEINVN